VLELIPIDAAIIACHADRAALGRLEDPTGTIGVGIAPDELWWVGPLEAREDLADRAKAALGAGSSLVVDQSDGWAVFALRGSARQTVLDRLMLAAIPEERPAFVQGAITGVPGKVIALEGVTYLFVPAPVGHHLRDRILSVAADLSPRERGAEPFSLTAGERAAPAAAASVTL
jgi:hypothetical protein